MPELPEVEAWRRQLDPLAARSPVEQAGPAHIATLKTIEPPLSMLDGQSLKGVDRRNPIVGGHDVRVLIGSGGSHNVDVVSAAGGDANGHRFAIAVGGRRSKDDVRRIPDV